VRSVHRQKTTLRLFAHNAGFDLRCVDAFRQIPLWYPKIKLACLKAPPVIIDCSRPGYRIICLDTMNWWRERLAKLGERLRLPKLDMPLPDAPPEIWDAYCRRDVEILMETVKRWIGFLLAEDLGSFKPTLAGQSLSAFRHRFMKTRILLDRDDQGLRLARTAYHGGRVECFRIGEIPPPVHHLDINSMYPAVMAGEKYPVHFAFSRGETSISQLEQMLSRYSIIARATIKTETPCYCMVKDTKSFYPVGTFETVLTTPELIRALSEGSIVKVHEATGWRSAPVFKPFVDYFYAKRMEARASGDSLGDWLFKILMNSLYGKFGQHGIRSTVVGYCPTDEVGVEEYINVDTGERGQIVKVFGQRRLEIEAGESRMSHPAIAAHVTAYARMALWDLIERAGRSETYYCDTDSLFVSPLGYERLQKDIAPDALGALKDVGKYDRVVLFGAKDYLIGDKRTLKGVRSAAKQLAPGVFEQERWIGLTGALRLGIVDAPLIASTTKTLKRVYDKGEVDLAGRVTPWRLG